jgi:hypothetical protein
MILTTEQILDDIQRLRNVQATYNKSVDKEIASLTMRLEMMMDAKGLDSVKSELASAGYRNNTSVEVADWNALMEYVQKNSAFDCIQKRVAPAQLEKRIKDGAVIKGVTIKKSKTFVITGVKET